MKTIVAKRLLTLALLVLCCISTDASGLKKLLVVRCCDSQVYEFVFAENPLVSFDGANVYVAYGDSEMSFGIAGVENISFQDYECNQTVLDFDALEWRNDTIAISDSEISTVIEGAGEISQTNVRYDFTFISQELLRISGISNINAVSVYSADGRIMAFDYYKDDDSVIVRLTNLSSGVYIINAGKQSIKFKK